MKVKVTDVYLFVVGILLTVIMIFRYSSLSSTEIFSKGGHISNILMDCILILGGLFFSFLYFGISKKEIIIYPLLIIGAFLSGKVSNSSAILQIVIMMFGLRKFSFEKIMKLFGISMFVATSSILFGRMIGIFKSSENVVGSYKESFGFSLANTAGIMFLGLLIVLLYFNRERTSWLNNILVVTFLVLLYETHARTSEIVAIIVLIIWLLLHNKSVKEFMEKHMTSIAMITILLAITFSILSAVSMRNIQIGSLLYKLNDLMSNRLQLGYDFLTNYGVTLLGQNVDYNTTSTATKWWDFSNFMWLDNAYLKLIINFGIIWLILYIYGIYRATIKAKLVNNPYFLIPLIGMVIIGTSESMMISNIYNFVLFSFVATFTRNEKSI